jgi:hypothetical protein
MNTQAFLLSLLLIGSVMPTAFAQTPSETPQEEEAAAESPETPAAETTAAINPADPNCRQTNRTVDIFAKPSVGADSSTLGILEPEARVTIASVGANGWVPVTAPLAGFVIARHLKPCAAVSTEPAQPVFQQDPTLLNLTPGSCRRAALGLVVRPRPEVGSEPLVGRLQEGMRATLTGESNMDDEFRLWLRISAPYAGWISGGQEGGTNLAFCGS